MKFGKKFFDAGIDAMGNVREKAEKIVNEMVEKGEIKQSEAKEAIEELVKKGEKQTEEFRKAVKLEIAELKDDFSFAKKQDVEKIQKEIEQIKKRLYELEMETREIIE